MFITWCTWRQHNTVYLKICEEGESYVGYLLFMINWIFLFIRKAQSKKKSFSCGKEKEDIEILRKPLVPKKHFSFCCPQSTWTFLLVPALLQPLLQSELPTQRGDSLLASTPHPSLSSPWYSVPWVHLEGTQQKIWVNNPIILIFHLYWLTLGGKAQTCQTNAFKLLPLVLLEEWRHSYKYFKA